MRRWTIADLSFAFLLAPASLGAVFDDPSQLPCPTYDYVIVGAGTAGNVIANRLTEDPSIRVLVLEAGVSNVNVTGSIIPFLEGSVTAGSPYDWNYTTTVQPGANNHSFPFPRGRMLGGSSSTNGMFHMYGSSEDYDRIAAVTGDPGWNWESVKKNIGKHERIVPPTDGHNTTGQYIPANHGTHGILPVSLPGNSQAIDARVIATTKELAQEFPFNEDMGGGEDILGIGWLQSSIGGGMRSSSATTYLAAALDRPNLDIIINAQVTKLLRNGAVGGLPSFHAVQFARAPSAGMTTTVTPSVVSATKEIILSAGTIGTPQILQLSGIGPQADLEALNIPVIVNNPSVGRNLSDHVISSNVFSVKGNDSLDNLMRSPALLSAALDQWNANHTGVMSNNIANNVGFLRLPSNSSIFQTTPDPSAGPKASHWELFVANFFLLPEAEQPTTGSYLSLVNLLISPTSRGTLKLASSDPFAKPLIDPNYLTTEFDIFALREAVKAIKRFAASTAWEDYIVGPVGGLASTTDSAIDAYIRGGAFPGLHPVGTASMSPKGAHWGVVDPDLKVKGVEGVRVVDASVFPFVPNGHLQGPTYLMAERAAQLFQDDTY